MRRAVFVASGVLLLAACSPTPPASPPPAAPSAGELARKVTADGMYAHLQKLADIATANGDSRADGTPGFDASVDYVAKLLQDKGFD
ncbi:MAG: peptidase M28, partial [Actinomycetota bacterium]|nr:peptidase M28 [Actinomycetota bacterium]